MRKYAAEDGSLDREAFASVVADAREAAGPVQRDDDVVFQLVLEDGDRIPASPFLALALALRHRCELAAGDVFDGPHAVDATDLDLPIQRLEALVADGARLSAHFATMFDAATRDAALPSPRPCGFFVCMPWLQYTRALSTLPFNRAIPRTTSRGRRRILVRWSPSNDTIRVGRRAAKESNHTPRTPSPRHTREINVSRDIRDREATRAYSSSIFGAR